LLIAQFFTSDTTTLRPAMRTLLSGPVVPPGVPGPDDTEMEWWDALLADMRAEAAAYDDEGWETLELHPGDVTARDGSVEDLGLDVLVPDNEFADLEAALADGVDGYEVLRSTAGHYVALLVVVEAAGRDLAVFVPAYYSGRDDAAATLLRKATGAGELTLILRTLTDDRVELALDDPELFVPDGD
jgi:hypothetical protein